MQLITWFLKLLGVAICSEIQPIQAPYDGSHISSIDIIEDGKLSQKNIVLQSVTKEFAKSYSSTAWRQPSELDYSKGIVPDFTRQVKYEIPVWDQGIYGTCVTFSTLSAIEQVTSKPFSTSPQCTLELLAGQGQNLWNGAYNSDQIVKPLQEHGITSILSCPRTYPHPWNSLTPSQYHMYVTDTIDKIETKFYPKISLHVIKKAIDSKNLVTIGFLMKASKLGTQGFDVRSVADSQTRFSGGLWACKQGLSENLCGQPDAGHAVVVYGYDDRQRLLKIRNSWSDKSGYYGDFFMTYEFFLSQVIDGTVISKKL